MISRRPLATATCSVVALLCLAARCERREPGLVPPDDARLVSTGSFGERTYETGYENPIIAGFTPLDLSEFEVTRREDVSLLVETSVIYDAPVLVNVRISDREVHEPAFLDLARGGLDLQWNFPFAGPRLSLVPGEGSVRVRVETVTRGSSGEFIARADSIRYQLAPNVLVVPVNALVFAGDDGALPYLGGNAATASGVVSQLFDPAGARGNRLHLGDGYQAATSELAHFTEASPDLLWHQCGIQFHLEDVQVVPQGNGLEEELVASTDPCFSFTNPPVGPHLAALRTGDALPLLFGGAMRHMLLTELLGATCHSGSTSAYVAVNGRHALRAGIVAHELGHVFLGTAHTSDAANLMTPPNPRTGSIAGTELTEDQCLLARCGAARLLASFGRLESSRVDEECAPFNPVCGDGEVEGSEDCDDGNMSPGDGCRADCTAEICGDGQLDPGEQCDWRIPEQQSNCDDDCQLCNGCNVCGNGVVDPGEECDDGNDDPLDVCSNDCHFTLG